MKITKFKRKNFILSFIVFLTYAFLTITINSCKKETQTNLQVGRLNIGNNNTLEVLKGAFTAGDYQKKLSRNFNDSLVITWKPDWQSVTEKMGNDTLNYFYIPLNGEFYNKKTGISKKIRTINTDKYLIGFLNKKGIKYKVGTYVVQTDTNKFDYTINSDSKKIKSVQFINHTVKYSKFSGTLVLLDLYNNNTNTYKYNNGIYQPKNQKISANSQSKNSNSSQINTNAEFCSYTLTCTYFNNFQDACGDGIDYEENSTPINDPNIGEQNCTPPPSAASDSYGGLCYIYWEFGGYNVQLDFCFTIPDPPPLPPPPPPPQDPGDGSNSDPNADNNLTITDTLLKKDYPCAVKLIIDSLSKFGDYEDLVRPFTTSQKPNLDWTSDVLPWAGITGTGQLSNQLGLTSTDGRSAVIALNKSMLNNSSQLLIAGVAVHETLHAVINYNIGTAGFHYQDSTVTLGSWLYGVDSWALINGLPSNFADHFEMMDFYFNKAVSILASWDNNAHPINDYQKVMLYGLNNPGVGNLNDANYASRVTSLNIEYNKLLTKYKITASDLDTYWKSQLVAPATNKLPTSGCDN